MTSTDDNMEESEIISTVEAKSLQIEQPPVEYQVEETAATNTVEPVPEETHDAIVPLATQTEVQQTLISQLRASEDPLSPSTTHMDSIEPEEDENTQTEVQFAVGDVRLEESDPIMDETLNQRQEEEEEETHREAESKEEEEESKDGDNGKEEEESKEGEVKEEAKALEEMENQEEIENNLMEERKGEEDKEKETESNPAAEDRHSPLQEQDKQIDINHEQDDQTSLGNNAELDLESETAATPAPENAVSPSSLNLAEVVDDEHISGDEPVIFTRRVYYDKRFYILRAHS